MTRPLKWPGRSLTKSNVLILALSANLLVRAARCSGYQAYSLDCYADVDTQDLAEDAQRIGYANGLWDIEAIQHYIDQLKHLPIEAIVVGSGLEQYPQQLEALKSDIPILQNPATSHAAIHRMFSTSALLSASVQFAETSLSPVTGKSPNDWLIKPIGGSGGLGIRRASAGQVLQKNEIYQRFISGESYSLTLIAANNAVQLLGLNQLWNIHTPNSVFAYGGCMNHLALPEDRIDALETESRKLCRELELYGLLGIDFIADDNNTLHIVDINPRPTASFALYDDQQVKLFQAHLDSLRGLDVPMIEVSKTIQAHAVVYAGESLCFIEEQTWPEWISSKPPLGSKISPGEPVCVIHAEADSHVRIKQILRERYSVLEKCLNQRTSLRISKEI